METNPLMDAGDGRHRLERLYRSDPAKFAGHLDRALQLHPESLILKFWQTRFENAEPITTTSFRITVRQILPPLLLCLIATLLVRAPSYLPIEEAWFYTRFAPLIVIAALIFYFASQSTHEKSEILVLIAAVLATCLTMLFMPDDTPSSSVVMSIIHAPLVMWSLLGLAFTDGYWRHAKRRLDYLRYGGEMFIYTALILLGGMVLTGMTFALFNLIGFDIQSWYLNNVVVAGLVSAPILATSLYDQVLHRKSRLATTIAKLFTPLFLITITLYLVAMLIAQRSPYTDRDFLILFNGLLLLVLAMTIFSICGRNHDHPSRLTDVVNLGLVGVTLLVNIVALSAILYRFLEWGISPNRVVALGANVLVFVHLIQILNSYVSVFRGKASAEKLISSIARFLPVYGMWAIIVMVVLPIFFGYK